MNFKSFFLILLIKILFNIPQSSAQQNFPSDSLFLQKKSDFLFLETQTEKANPDTSKADQKKKFIENQIKTKIVAQPKKTTGEKKQGIVKADTALLQTVIPEVTEEFKFRDIILKPEENKTTVQVKKQVYYKPFFEPHELSIKNEQSITLNHDNPVWSFFLLLVLVSGFSWIKVFYPKTIRDIFQAAVNISVTNQMLRDENLLLQRASLLLTIMFNLVAAFFLYEISMSFEWSSDYIGSGFGRFLIFAFAVSFVYSFKFIFLRLTAFIFKTDKPVSVYIFNIFLINNILGITLLPLIIGISFLPQPYSKLVIYISLALIILGFFYRILRGLLNSLGHSEFSKFHLLLYLCTLEIAPLLVFIKLFSQ